MKFGYDNIDQAIFADWQEGGAGDGRPPLTD